MNTPEKRTSILIVEDHGIASTGLQFLLGREETIRVLGVVHRGDQAEAEIAGRNPDIVILDLALPGKSGLVILENLKTREPQRKVIILSGQASGMEFKRAIGLGADAVISKTDPPELIVEVLDSLAQGARFISHTVRALVEPVGDARGHGLTARERQVLILLAEGLSNAGIAKKIGAELRTVRKHRENLMRKMSLEKVRAHPERFLHNQTEQINSGITGDVVWLRFDVLNAGAEQGEWLLHTLTRSAEILDFYLIRDGPAQLLFSVRDSSAALQNHDALAAAFQPAPGEQVTVYIRYLNQHVSRIPQQILSFADAASFIPMKAVFTKARTAMFQSMKPSATRQVNTPEAK